MTTQLTPPLKQFTLKTPSYGEHPAFVLNITKIEAHCITWECRQVASWAGDGSMIPNQTPPYCAGLIKWDGCSHVWFGENEDGKDGYLHLCGVRLWQDHVACMEWIYKTCYGLLENPSPDELWGNR